MGFGREIERVRDVSLPIAFRAHALGSAIQVAQPIGFNATWSYLQDKVQLSWRDPGFLLPAAALLEEEHRLHVDVEVEYARLRRAQKAAGLRFPPRSDATATLPRRWHGDERLGAFHALATWRRGMPDPIVASHPAGRTVLDAVDSALVQPGATQDDPALQAVLNWSRRQIHVVGWESDASEYRVAWVVLRLLGQLHLLSHGAPAVGKPWNFRHG